MIRGLVTALITPFYEESIDYDSLKKLVEKQIDAKVSAVVLFGSTGEGAHIEPEERERAINFVLDVIAKRGADIKLFVGLSATSTMGIVRAGTLVKNAGGHGLLVSPTAYNNPTQDGIFDMYQRVASVGLPVLAYNVPRRVSVDISDDTIVRMSTIKNMIGVKDSTGDIRRIASLKHKIKNANFAVFAGDDYMVLSAMAHGAAGLVSVVSNVAPKVMSGVCQLCIDEKYKEANCLFDSVYPIFESIFCQTNPIPVKFVAKHTGLIRSDELRSPLMSLSEEGLMSRLRQDASLLMEKEGSM